jgi:argininosuccinate lyase
MDSVSDRDSLIEFCSNSAIIMMHLSRFCEELILWSSSEFQFVEISDSFCTGSSIMPQKKNPDVPELVRGKTGRVYGNLMSLLTLMKALPLAYNRDLQEDKTALFDTVETTKNCLNIFSLMLPEIKVNKQKMAEAAQSGFLTATDLADYLAGKGVPFRTAHEVVGSIVSYCVREKKTFRDLSFNELKRFSTDFKRDALKYLTIESSVNSRKCIGGTGKQAVKRAITKAKTELRKGEKFIEKNKFRN